METPNESENIDKKPELDDPTAKDSVKTPRKKFNLNFSKFRSLSGKHKAFICLILVLVMVFAGGLTYYLRIPKKTTSTERVPIKLNKLEDIEIKPEKEDTAGVSTDSKFIFSSKNPLTVSQVKQSLKLEPAADFEVTAQTDKTFEISVKNGLTPNNIYKIKVAAQSSEAVEKNDLLWAFQTKNEFKVLQTLPRKEASGVPTNSGIEITFSHENYNDDFANYFEISPKVEGRFERHQRVLAFIPKSLQEGTLYTVKVKKGLGLKGSDQILDNDVLFQFETKVNNYNNQDRSGLVFSKAMYETSTTEKPSFDFTVETSSGLQSASITLYKFPDTNTFIDALKSRDAIPSWASYATAKYLYDTGKLQKVQTNQISLTFFSNTNSAYTTLPQALPQGLYLVETVEQNKKNQSYLQITDIASYISASKTKTLVWVHDLKTNKPLQSAKVEVVDTNISTTTAANGAIAFDTPKDISYVKVSDSSGRIAIVPPYFKGEINEFYCGYSLEQQFNRYDRDEDYWSYIYVDKPIYKQTDTVKFWGMLKERNNPNSKKNFKILLTGTDTFDYNYNRSLLQEKQIALTDFNTFTGEFSFSNLTAQGGYQLEVRDGEDTVLSKYLYIQDYVKPLYEISVNQSKKAVFADEEVEIYGNVKFFEGTGVPNLKLKYSGSAAGEVKTDSNGKYSFKYKPKFNSYSTYINQSSEYINITPGEGEESEISEYVSTSVYNSRVNIQVDSSVNGEKAKAKVKLNWISLDKLNNGSATDYGDYLGAPAKNRNVTGTLYELTDKKTEDGEYYDFINKTVVKKYKYETITNKLNDVNLTTNDKGEAEYEFPANKDKYYKLELVTKDDAGKAFANSTIINGTPYTYDNVYNNPYSLQSVSSKDSSAYHGFKPGDKEKVVFKKEKETLPTGGDNQYIFFKSQRGIRTFSVQESPEFEYTLNEEDIPNIKITGVYFNGQTYVTEESTNNTFDTTTKKLDVTVTSDKNSYKPKDTVNLDIAVRDGKGSPVKSEVNISVVDESLFKIYGQYVNPLNDIYKYVSSGIKGSYSSHQYPKLEDFPGGCGSTGGDRYNFPDTALFTTIRTDDKGEGKVTFKLPDNLTTWRITYQALSNDKSPFVGSDTKPLLVKQPFFTDMVINSEYLVSDKPVFKARAFGDALTANQEVNYFVTAPSLGLKEEKKVTGKGFSSVEFDLPALSEGEHKVTIRAKAGENEDTLTRSVKVIPSRLTKSESNFTTLTQDTLIKGSKSLPTTITFSNLNRGRYYAITKNLANSEGLRVDQKLAQIKGNEFLKKYFNETGASVDSSIMTSYQTYEGGISLLPYSDNDLLLSAQIADGSVNLFSKNGLAQYFHTVFDSTKESRERAIIALFGLASLSEPVLVQVNLLLTLQDLTPTEKLYLGLAEAKLGNLQKSREVLKEILEKHGEDLKPFYRVNLGKNQDEILSNTALTAHLAQLSLDSSHMKLFDYLFENYTSEILLNLDSINYLNDALPTTSNDTVSFTYTIGDKKETKQLNKNETFRLQLSPEDLTKIKFENIQGNIGVASEYLVPFDANSVAKDKNISVNRTYSIDNKVTTSFSENALVKITLDYKVGSTTIDGCYRVTDTLPSGLKPAVHTYVPWMNNENVWYPYEISGQKVSFCVFKKNDGKPIVYYARVVTKGSYQAESATIQSIKTTNSLNYSNTANIMIK